MPSNSNHPLRNKQFFCTSVHLLHFERTISPILIFVSRAGAHSIDISNSVHSSELASTSSSFHPPFAFQNPTLTPFVGDSTTSDFNPCVPSCQYFSILSNRCRILTIVYPISVRANCCPMQILGPPLNLLAASADSQVGRCVLGKAHGMYVQLFGVQLSHLSGEYIDTCGKSAEGGG